MGELVRGKALVAPTAKTTTGTGTAVSVGAAAEGQRLVARLHVIAKTGGGTLDVVLQSDSAEGMSSPTTRITFDQVSAVGSQTKIVTTAISDTWYRESRTITSGSFTYVVSIGVAGVATAAGSQLPLTGQSDIVLAPPLDLGAGAQTFAMLVGPDAQLGSTSGGDTNDPTYVAGPPKRFTFDANDYITFGDVLDAVFINAAGFTIIHAMRTPTDQSGNKAMIGKTNSSPDYGFVFQTDGGVLGLRFSHDGTAANRTQYSDTVASLTADTKYIAATSYNPAAARADRCKIYVNGVPRTVGNSPSGSDGPGIDTTAELRIGLHGDGDVPTGRESNLFYIWDRVLSDGEVDDATDEIDALAGGWL